MNVVAAPLLVPVMVVAAVVKRTVVIPVGVICTTVNAICVVEPAVDETQAVPWKVHVPIGISVTPGTFATVA